MVHARFNINLQVFPLPITTIIKLNFKRRRVEKSDFYLAENIQLILQKKNDVSRLDFSHDYKYLQKP